jgi:hypothetical protein
VLIAQRSSRILTLIISLSLTLSACAGTQSGQSLERSLAADPRLADNSEIVTTPSPQITPAPNSSDVSLPEDFPSQIPLYPQAELKAIQVLIGNSDGEGKLTRWTSSDSRQDIETFYQNQLKNNWKSINKSSSDPQGTIAAQQGNLQVKVMVEPATTAQSAGTTNFVVKYWQTPSSTQANSNPTTNPQATSKPTTSATPDSETLTPSGSFSDLDKTPTELRPYLNDLAQLEVLTPATQSSTTTTTAGTLFEPNKTITRREFARWLVAANNQIYAKQPSRKIRLGVESSKPAFEDISQKDPDFAVIQGLAEAGIIPSPLSGESEQVQFKPNTPLTREELLLWKVPLDMRRALPTASVDAVQKTWGFQDANKISPEALRALQGDYENGDLSNIRRVFGYTTLFQPDKAVTRAEGAATLWYFGTQGDGLSAKDVLQSQSAPNENNQP